MKEKKTIVEEILSKKFPMERVTKENIIDNDHLILTTSKSVAESDDYGEKGTFCYDNDFLYICTGKNTWKKIKLNAPGFDLTTEDVTDIQNLSGINTGDQDLSSYAELDEVLLLDQTTPQTITATDTTITASDEIYFGDATDTFKIKKDTIQGIIDLVAEKPFAQQGRLSLPQLASATYLIEEIPGWAFSGQTNSIKAVSAWLVPIYVSRSVSYRGFRYDIYSTTGKTADSYRLGIYDIDYSTGLPKNLVWDSSKQTFGTTTGSHQIIGLNIPLTEGWYYIVGTKNGNINLYGSSPAQQRPPLGGFGASTTKQILTSTTADWTNGFPNPWVNNGFSHMNTDGYEASFFKLYRNSEA